MLQLRRSWTSKSKGDDKVTWSKGGYKGAWSKGGFKGNGKGIWQVDGDEAQGDFNWNQQAEEQPRKETSVVGQDGNQVVKRSRALGNFMPGIFAVGEITKRGSKTVSGSAGL